MGKNMKKSRKRMWGGMWPFNSGDAAGTNAAPAANAAPVESGIFAGFLGTTVFNLSF